MVAAIYPEMSRLSRAVPARSEGSRELRPSRTDGVHECDARSLGAELRDELRAQAGRTATHERHATLQAWVPGVVAEWSRGHHGTTTDRPTPPIVSLA